MYRVLNRLLLCTIPVLLAGCASSNNAPDGLGANTGQEKYTYKGGRYDPSARGGRHGLGAMAAGPEGFKAAAEDIVYFSSDSSDVTPEGQTTLAAQARWLQQYPSQTVAIEGHADERGTREYNIALGARRATSVKSMLVANGINAARIRTMSYGKERPVMSCDDISCWSRNRRAQTLLGSTAVSRN